MAFLICRALFHCNYCNKDISNTIRVKCAVCPDFDLCLECFSVGVEIRPHKRTHAYRVVDNLSFPLFAPDWGVRLPITVFSVYRHTPHMCFRCMPRGETEQVHKETCNTVAESQEQLACPARVSVPECMCFSYASFPLQPITVL